MTNVIRFPTQLERGMRIHLAGVKEAYAKSLRGKSYLELLQQLGYFQDELRLRAGIPTAVMLVQGRVLTTFIQNNPYATPGFLEHVTQLHLLLEDFAKQQGIT